MTNSRSSKNTTGFRTQNRYITDHDENGVSIFSSYPEKAVYEDINPEMDFFVAYCNTFSPNLNNSADLADYKKVHEGPQPPLTIPGGTILRVCNFAPGSTTAMHRTTSLDYGIVLEGEVELVLDSGEVRLLKAGDIAVQRGTMHAWRTPSKDQWSRMVFILQDSKPIEVGGKTVGDDYGGLEVQSVNDFADSLKQ
jgi:quercetin dioxygenase-like cupin family protein